VKDKKKAITFKQFKRLKLPEKLISNGIVLIWSHKKILMELLEHMTNLGFSYIENLAFVQLSCKKILKHLIEKNCIAEPLKKSTSLIQNKLLLEAKASKGSKFLED